MIHLTLDKVYEYADAAVAEKGEDYVYTNPDGDRSHCLYVHGSGEDAVPGCIVGNILARAGLELSESWNDRGSVFRLFGKLSDSGLIQHDDGVLAFLRAAQRDQDFGYTWGDSVRTAKVAVQKWKDNVDIE